MFGELSVSLFVTLGVCMGGSVNVEVVRKGIIAELMLQYLLNTFTNVFCRTVLGDKASKLKQVPRFLKVDHHHTRQEEDQSMKKSCLVSSAFFLSSLRCVHGCIGMDV